MCELFASIFLEKSKVRRGLGGSDHVEMNGYILNHSDPGDLSDTNSNDKVPEPFLQLHKL